MSISVYLVYLKYLEERGKNINTATLMDVKVYLATRTKESTRHRDAATIKRFYRFLY